MTSSQPPPRPSTFVARTATDLVAIVPVVLGFHPRDSVVLLTFGTPGAAFHARVDLPIAMAEQEEVADVLVGAVTANHADRVAVLLYTDDVEVAHSQFGLLLGRLLERGVEVIDVLRVDDGRWHSLPEDGSPGTAYDLGSHPFTAQGVFEGQVVHRDRSELADTLVGTDEDDAVAVALAATRFAELMESSRETGHAADRGALAAAVHPVPPRRRRAARRRSTPAGCWCSPRWSRRATWRGPRSLVPPRGATSSCGEGWCAGLRGTCCPAPARCWRSPPGSTVTAPSRGVRSTAASTSTRTTRWPTASRRS